MSLPGITMKSGGYNYHVSDSLDYVGISNIPYNDEGWRLNTL